MLSSALLQHYQAVMNDYRGKLRNTTNRRLEADFGSKRLIERFPPRMVCMGFVLCMLGQLVVAQESATPAKKLALDAQGDSVPAVVEIPEVTFYFGGGSTNPASQIIKQRTGVTPYDTNQVFSIVELRRKAARSLRDIGIEIDESYRCNMTVALKAGKCSVRFTQGVIWSSVEMDSDGVVVTMCGGTGIRGEGYWRIESQDRMGNTETRERHSK